jgi:hypothetical protein
MAFLMANATYDSCFFSSHGAPAGQHGGTMSSDDLLTIVRRLPISAPDMRDDGETLFAALTSHCGKLSAAIKRLEDDPSDANANAETVKHCGAAILILGAIVEGRNLSLENALRAGEKELQ